MFLEIAAIERSVDSNGSVRFNTLLLVEMLPSRDLTCTLLTSRCCILSGFLLTDRSQNVMHVHCIHITRDEEKLMFNIGDISLQYFMMKKVPVSIIKAINTFGIVDLDIITPNR